MKGGDEEDGTGNPLFASIRSPSGLCRIVQGAWARDPIGPRLLQMATTRRIPFKLTFLYGGSHDWMDWRLGAVVR